MCKIINDIVKIYQNITIIIIYQIVLIKRSLIQFIMTTLRIFLFNSNTKVAVIQIKFHVHTSKIRFYLCQSAENIQILIYCICHPIARFSYLIVYRRYYILFQRPGIFIFTFCSVWQSRKCMREMEIEIEKNLLRGGASHLQERVRRESAAHTVKSMMIGYSHARERRYSIDINTHATGANVIEKPRSSAFEPPTKRIYRVCGFLLPTIINRESEFRLIRKRARARAHLLMAHSDSFVRILLPGCFSTYIHNR